MLARSRWNQAGVGRLVYSSGLSRVHPKGRTGGQPGLSARPVDPTGLGPEQGPWEGPQCLVGHICLRRELVIHLVHAALVAPGMSLCLCGVRQSSLPPGLLVLGRFKPSAPFEGRSKPEEAPAHKQLSGAADRC